MADLLGLRGFEVIQEPEESATDYLIHVRCQTEPRECPKCGTVEARLYKHGTDRQLVMDTPLHGKRVGLRWHRQRYKCRECEGTFMESPWPIDSERRMTERLRFYVEKRSINHTFASVGRDVGVDEKTVRNVFDAYVQRRDADRTIKTPQWLGIDEVHLLGKPRGITANLKRRAVIDVLRSRKRDAIWRHLRGFSEPGRVRVVTMDMWRPYRDAARECFPQADVVVDKFHVVRMASQAVDAVRKAVGRTLSAKDKRRLMRSRHYVLRRRGDLSEAEIMKRDAMIDARQMADLREAYWLKEDFYDLFDEATGRREARERLDAWRAKVDGTEAFGPLLTALSNWEQEILSYFRHRATNGYVEALNGVAKCIQRMGRGYSFDVIRAKIIYGHEHLTEMSQPYGRDFDIGYTTRIPSFETLDIGVAFSTLRESADSVPEEN